jgi:hypothetical protein
VDASCNIVVHVGRRNGSSEVLAADRFIAGARSAPKQNDRALFRLRAELSARGIVEAEIPARRSRRRGASRLQ